MKCIFLASALLVAGVVQASAADLVVNEPVPVPAEAAFDWTGFYVGGQAGFGWGDAGYAFPYAYTDGPFTNNYNQQAGDAFSHRMSGGLVGGHIGYNQQFGNFVAGIEASIALANIGKSDVASPYYDKNFFSTEVEWYAALTPRLGFAHDNWHFYGKGGLAYGQVHSRIHGYYDPELVYLSETFRRVGWTAGAGVDYALADNIILGLAYEYVDFGSHTISRLSTNGEDGTPWSNGSTHSVDASFHAVSARLSWKLN